MLFLEWHSKCFSCNFQEDQFLFAKRWLGLAVADGQAASSVGGTRKFVPVPCEQLRGERRYAAARRRSLPLSQLALFFRCGVTGAGVKVLKLYARNSFTSAQMRNQTPLLQCLSFVERLSMRANTRECLSAVCLAFDLRHGELSVMPTS